MTGVKGSRFSKFVVPAQKAISVVVPGYGDPTGILAGTANAYFTRFSSAPATASMIVDAAAVTTDSGASTATLIHQASSSQILLINVFGSFDSGDYVTDGTKSVVLSDNGAPAIAVAKIDGAWTSADTQGVTINGWTTGTSTSTRA